MEYITFIKALQKKGKIYYDFWLIILFKLEENNTIKMDNNLGLSKTQFYRILHFGVKLWSEIIQNDNLEYKCGKLTVITSNASKKTTPKKAEKNKSEKNDNGINMNEVYESIISYLNQKAGTSYKSNTNSYKNIINSRFKDGYRLEDFYKVIENKSDDWYGTDYAKFLRPETLFGNKFETYLNQKNSKKTAQDIAYEQVSKATELGWNNSKL